MNYAKYPIYFSVVSSATGFVENWFFNMMKAQVILFNRRYLSYFLNFVIIFVRFQWRTGANKVAVTVDIIYSSARWPKFV
mmetsp:Transcript_22787/g.50879  ORF Transcript_22787/g.50879 Transcript_22787/m.50879 type:complete len:80 (-) Transcript_22787:3203-3442(-)